MDETRAHLRRGFNWLGGAAVVAKGVDLGTLFAVLLYLTKAQVGIASLVVAAGTVVEALDGLGTREALIQARSVSRTELDSLFWFILGAALLVGALVLLAAPLFGAAYGIAGITVYFIAVAAKQPIVGAAVIPLALMNRDLQYERIAIVNVCSTLGAALTRLALATAGAGVWALVIGHLASGLYTLIGALIARPFRPRWRVRRAEVAPLARFGVPAATANLLDQLLNNLHYLLIGAFYGPAELAVYRVAFTVAMEPAIAVSTLINRTALPVFVRAASVATQLEQALTWSLRRLARLYAPYAAAVIVAAAPLTALIHDGRGHSYAAAAVPLELLAVAALLRVTAQLLVPLVIARGRPGVAARVSTTTLVGLVAGLASVGMRSAAPSGIRAAAIVWIAVYAPLLLWTGRYLRREGLLGGRDIGRAFLAPSLGAIALGIGVMLLHAAIGPLDPRLDLGAVLGAAALIYAGLGWHARRRGAESG